MKVENNSGDGRLSPMNPLVRLICVFTVMAAMGLSSGLKASDLIIPAATNATAAGSNTVVRNVDALTPFSTKQSTNPAPEFIVSGGEKYASVSFTRLASFTYQAQQTAQATSDAVDSIGQEAQIPAGIKSLNEKSVAVTGFMLPLHSSGDLATDFLLLRNQSACCYGVMPKVNEWVIVRTTGKGVKVTMDIPVTVLGTLHVGEMRENGELSGIYELDCDKVLNPKS